LRMIEREIKLSAERGVVLPDIGAAVPGMTVGAPSTLHLEAVYYDTPTLALARSGTTLRSRTGEPGDAWTLKLPGAVNGSEMSRDEITEDAPLGTVPPALVVATHALARSQDLVEVLRLHTRRITFDLAIGGRPFAHVCDDDVAAEPVRGQPSAFREIEV